MKIKVFLLSAGLLTLGSTYVLGTSTIVTWMKDMYNQISIKSQERGMMMTFPVGIVSVDGRSYETQPLPMSWADAEKNPKTTTKNMVKATQDSIQNGKRIYNIYCAACHAENGMGITPVTQKGMPAMPIKMMTQTFTDGHLYKKIKHGGAIMPPFGYATSEQERWNIVNYLRVLEKAQ